ncbi:MAG: hypothetical protein BWY09_02377 [Candidatus Hydrogenedentes bacterium ADurb.Bin179]|nr:MAG: hypothetical protein BWY09_02377 [Candidatus Hydrogenedentes bacterium ADurb.Bin179]
MAHTFWRRSAPVGRGWNSARLTFFRPPVLFHAATAALCNSVRELVLYWTANWSRFGSLLKSKEVPLFWCTETGWLLSSRSLIRPATFDTWAFDNASPYSSATHQISRL